MVNSHHEDTFLGSLWRSNRKRVRLLIVVALVLFSTIFLFSKEHSFVDEWQPAVIAGAELPSTVTVTVTRTTATYTAVETQAVALSEKAEPVVFSLIMWSRDSAIEGALLIKTILLYTSSPTEFHIICDQPARDLLESRFSLLTNPLHPTKVRFYQPSLQSIKDRLVREGNVQSDHPSGIPGLMKLFIHEILPSSIKKSIYIDTDAMFISDPTLLWNVFSQLKPATAVAMSYHPDENSPMWHYASRICSCVMLLDLEKLRRLRLMDSSLYKGSSPSALSPPAFRAMYGEPGPNGYDNVKLGDQGYWWAIVEHRPDIFEPLSFDFEVTSCLMDTYSISLGDDGRHEADELPTQSHTKGTPQEGTLIRPKLLHFNCLHGTDVYMNWKGWSDHNESVVRRWGPAMFYHHGYKWIWLNQGPNPDSHAEMVDVGTAANVEFADLQLARGRAKHVKHIS